MALTENERDQFIELFYKLAEDIHRGCREAGFWPTPASGSPPANFGEKIALAHSELSEALEGYRAFDRDDDHLPGSRNAGVELADAVIRIMDLAVGFDYPLAEDILEKHAYNQTRSHKHGKAF